MSEMITLRNGIEIPKKELLASASELYDDFKTYPDLLLRFSYVANQNFDEVVMQKHFNDNDLFNLSAHFLLHVGPLERICTDQMMARAAVAASMIVALESDGELEGYLQEPVEDDEILPVLHKKGKNLTNQMLLMDPFYYD